VALSDGLEMDARPQQTPRRDLLWSIRQITPPRHVHHLPLVRGGRAAVRSILFLVAAIAAKYDKTLAAFRDRLLAAGKPKMVVRIALAHKLLVRLNAKARDARAQYANAT
jgi:hypothetical protein